jgi:hypothetical protein
VRLIAVIILFSEMTEKLDHKSAHKAWISDLSNDTTYIHAAWTAQKNQSTQKVPQTWWMKRTALNRFSNQQSKKRHKKVSHDNHIVMRDDS